MLSQKMVVVAGKGGVGRSTVAMAIALSLAAQGRSVAVVEVHGARALCGLFRVDPRHVAPVRVAPNLDLFALDAGKCLAAYTADRQRLAPLAGAVFGARVVRSFLDAIPGMADLLHLGLIHSLFTQGMGDHPPWDVVVLDSPPTGHGVAFTATARAMVEMTREGPIHEESLRIADLLDDPARTAQVVVTLPELLPVNEALALLAALGPQRDTVARIVANRVVPSSFGPGVWEPLREALGRQPDGRALGAVADRLARRLAGQDEALARLRDGCGPIPVVTLPDLERPPEPSSCGPLIEALRRTP